MIVLDASAVVDLLLHDESSFDWLGGRLIGAGPAAAPHLLDSEVGNALRTHVLSGRLEEARAAEALREFDDLPILRYAVRPFLFRIWALRHNLSAYDAAYVALAEALDSVLVTTERRLLDLPLAASSVRIESRHGSRPSS